MSTPKGVNQVRASDPSQAEILERAAEVRNGWTPEQEQRRRAEPSEPIVLTPLDGTTIGLSMADEQSAV